MASVKRKETFEHMQNVKTQTRRRVPDAASDQSLHILTLVTSMAHTFIAVYTI